jgi:hypothetical protein
VKVLALPELTTMAKPWRGLSDSFASFVLAIEDRRRPRGGAREHTGQRAARGDIDEHDVGAPGIAHPGLRRAEQHAVDGGIFGNAAGASGGRSRSFPVSLGGGAADAALAAFLPDFDDFDFFDFLSDLAIATPGPHSFRRSVFAITAGSMSSSDAFDFGLAHQFVDAASTRARRKPSISSARTSSSAGGACSRSRSAGSRASRTASAREPETSPASSSNTASSNSGTIMPAVNQPSCPPFGPDGPMEFSAASSAKSAPSASCVDQRLRLLLGFHEDVAGVEFLDRVRRRRIAHRIRPAGPRP